MMGETNLDKYNIAEAQLVRDIPKITYKEVRDRQKELWDLVPYNMDLNPVGLHRTIQENFKDDPDWKRDVEKSTYKINVGDISPEDAKAYIQLIANKFKRNS